MKSPFILLSKPTKIVIVVILCLIAIASIGASYLYFYTERVDCKCKIGIISRIVNGKEAPKNFVPYQVSLAVNGNHFCSAVIINSHWLLSAAHCIFGLNAYDITIRVGLHKLNETDLKDRTYKAFGIYPHESFKKDKKIFQVRDLGLIRTFWPIKFIPRQVEPACLNVEEPNKKYDDLLVTGWGTTTRSYKRKNEIIKKGKLSNVLKYAYYYESSDLICSNHLLCVKPRVSKDSNCHGDSGGPISFTRSSNTTVEGIASFNYPGEINDKIYMCVGPTGYSRLSSNKDFIEDYVGKNYCGNLN